jgi:hypothetical protein
MSQATSEAYVEMFLTKTWQTRDELRAKGIQGFNTDIILLRTLNRLVVQGRAEKQEVPFGKTLYRRA